VCVCVCVLVVSGGCGGGCVVEGWRREGVELVG
jgi:hypothetical protein